MFHVILTVAAQSSCVILLIKIKIRLTSGAISDVFKYFVPLVVGKKPNFHRTVRSEVREDVCTVSIPWQSQVLSRDIEIDQGADLSYSRDRGLNST